VELGSGRADPAGASDALRRGDLDLLGRMAWSSNATFLATATLGGTEIPVVYKPQRGERPLWDFPEGTLCRREVAAYELSAGLGWELVPETVLRDGPHGLGMVQRFVDHDPDEHYFTLLEEHQDVFQRFAVFDVLANNADRKGGHCLREKRDSHIWGIDHGLTFHIADKLRTVIWDFAGERIPDDLMTTLECAVDVLRGPLRLRLEPYLAPAELDAVERRADDLLRAGVFPLPDEGYHHVPWPLV
jgi:uncharacterized repeat protein (TIGR03843 family)